MISVYVAGTSANKDRARAFMQRVRACDGMRLAYDWVADVDNAVQPDHQISNEARGGFAQKDLDGVLNATHFVALAETANSGRGLWVELGYALGARELDKGEPVIIVSGGDRRCIFTTPHLVDAEFTGGNDTANDAATFELLRRFAEDRAGSLA